jgi:hypothetical protein
MAIGESEQDTDGRVLRVIEAFGGGATGALAERRGIEEITFTFDGHNEVRHRGVRVLNHEELLAGDVKESAVSG